MNGRLPNNQRLTARLASTHCEHKSSPDRLTNFQSLFANRETFDSTIITTYRSEYKSEIEYSFSNLLRMLTITPCHTCSTGQQQKEARAQKIYDWFGIGKLYSYSGLRLFSQSRFRARVHASECDGK